MLYKGEVKLAYKPHSHHLYTILIMEISTFFLNLYQSYDITVYIKLI